MKGLIAAHSGMRYIVLLLLIFAVVNAVLKMSTGKYNKTDRRINLFTLIFTHIQLLLGLAVYMISPKVQFNGAMMKNAVLRFFTMEHTLMMIIAILLITLGRRIAEKKENPNKIHQSIFTYFGIALIIIFLFIPWPFLRDVGAGYF